LFPVVTAKCDTVYKGDHIDRDIGDLPVHRWWAGEMVVGIESFWDMTPEERIAIAEGALIKLHIVGGEQPPVSLEIDDQPRELAARDA
jgi:hypothetical protein